MTSYERIVVDLQTARRMVQDAEKYREHSVYWEDGYRWEDTFEALIHCEQAELQTLLQSVDSTHVSKRNVIQYSQQLQPHLLIQESIHWHTIFCESLNQTQMQWEVDETISIEAYKCLERHARYITEHINLLNIMLRWIELQQLERQRRREGHVNTKTWEDTWYSFKNALLNYRVYFEQKYGAEEYDHVARQLSGWLEKILVMQQETLDLCYRRGNGNILQLQGHMRIVAEGAQDLQPKERNSWLSRIIAGLIGTMVCVVLLYSLWGSIAPAAASLQDQVAVPIDTSFPVGP